MTSRKAEPGKGASLFGGSSIAFNLFTGTDDKDLALGYGIDMALRFIKAFTLYDIVDEIIITRVKIAAKALLAILISAGAEMKGGIGGESGVKKSISHGGSS
jgi:hypothetical protein